MKKMMRFYVITFLISCNCFLNITAQNTIYRGDTIWTSETWSVDSVLVTGNIVIPDGVTLTILPGTYIEFQDYHHIVILGTLEAVGTETDNIVFTYFDTTGLANIDMPYGSWEGIIFNNSDADGGADGAMNDNDSSRLDYCIFEYSKSFNPDSLVRSTVEVVNFNRLIISNCEFRYNYSFYRGGAISLKQSNVKILNNNIHHNKAKEYGGGIYTEGSSPVIKKNTISYNQTTSIETNSGKGGGIASIHMNPVIKDNTITYNQAIYGSGVSLTTSHPIIENNIIAYNNGYNYPPELLSQGGGIFMGNLSIPEIINNVFSNNYSDQGGGIYSYNSKPEIISNLIVNNTAAETGGALYSNESETAIINNTISNNESLTGAALEIIDSELDFFNNVVWNNGGNEIHLQDPFAYINIKNCILENGESTIWGAGSYDSQSIIDNDPDFEIPSSGIGSTYDGLNADWSVSNTSPCINNGTLDIGDVSFPATDIQGNQRIYHTIIDIGAYEKHIELMEFAGIIGSDITWIADTVRITGDVTVNDDITLFVLPGTYIEFQGYYILRVNGTLDAQGIAGDRIIFTVNDTLGHFDINTTDGGWKGVLFDNSPGGMNNAMADNDSSIILNCCFKYVKHDITEYQGGAIKIRYYSKVRISECVFENNKSKENGGGIVLDKSDIKISGCEFYYNQANDGGAGIWATESNPVIEKNTFRHNKASFGAAIMAPTCEVIISNNIMTHNYSNRGGAIYLEVTSTEIANNYLSNNYAEDWGGAICADNVNIRMINNIIVNNTGNTGGGVFLRYTDNAHTINNTICNNAGGGMHTDHTNHRSVNDIIFGNEGKQYGISSSEVTLEFRNGNIEGGAEEFYVGDGQELPGTYTGLIDSLPAFVDPSDSAGVDYDGVNADWNLKFISPCINAGTLVGISQDMSDYDYYGNPRVIDTIDIGASESQYGPQSITAQPVSQEVCQGDTVTLSVETQYESYYQWQKDGVDIEGAVHNEYVIESILPEDDGNYRCIVTPSLASSEAEITVNPSPQLTLGPDKHICPGDPFTLDPVSEYSSYEWSTGETTKTISVTDGGTYYLNVTDYNGCKNSDTINLTMDPPIPSPDLGKDANYCMNELVILDASDLFDHYLWNTDSSQQTLHVSQTGTYWVRTWNDNSVCETSDTVHITIVEPYDQEEICLITVNMATGKNIIVWEKTPDVQIIAYKIHRQTTVAGKYELIGIVPSNEFSIYMDTVADPQVRQWVYKITAVDTCNNESDIQESPYHRPLFLTYNGVDDGVNLTWEPYVVEDTEIQFPTYEIFRGSDSTALSYLDEISGDLRVYKDTDPKALKYKYFYRVAGVKVTPCYPTASKKADYDTISQSMSNLEDNRIEIIEGMNKPECNPLIIYPNPFSNYTTIQFNNPGYSRYELFIRDLSGKVVYIKTNITEEDIVLKRENLKSGFYSVELVGEKVFRGRLIIN